MATRASSARRKSREGPAAATLMVRLDERSKALLQKAARLRRTSVSDYVRMITVRQAEKEIEAAEQQLIVLNPEAQLAFWKALNETPVLTPAQKRLGRIMRGEE